MLVDLAHTNRSRVSGGDNEFPEIGSLTPFLREGY